jgi:hypothetical protein
MTRTAQSRSLWVLSGDFFHLGIPSPRMSVIRDTAKPWIHSHKRWTRAAWERKCILKLLELSAYMLLALNCFPLLNLSLIDIGAVGWQKPRVFLFLQSSITSCTWILGSLVLELAFHRLMLGGDELMRRENHVIKWKRKFKGPDHKFSSKGNHLDEHEIYPTAEWRWHKSLRAM